MPSSASVVTPDDLLGFVMESQVPQPRTWQVKEVEIESYPAIKPLRHTDSRSGAIPPLQLIRLRDLPPRAFLMLQGFGTRQTEFPTNPFRVKMVAGWGDPMVPIPIPRQPPREAFDLPSRHYTDYVAVWAGRLLDVPSKTARRLVPSRSSANDSSGHPLRLRSFPVSASQQQQGQIRGLGAAVAAGERWE